MGTERALAAAEARRDALQQALGQSNTPSLRQQLEEATEEVEELQELLGVRAKRFAAGRPVTMTQGYAAYLRVHGIPRQRHASFSPQVTTPQSGSGPDDGLTSRVRVSASSRSSERHVRAREAVC